jgi:hypothetical protein
MSPGAPGYRAFSVGWRRLGARAGARLPSNDIRIECTGSRKRPLPRTMMCILGPGVRTPGRLGLHPSFPYKSSAEGAVSHRVSPRSIHRRRLRRRLGERPIRSAPVTARAPNSDGRRITVAGPGKRPPRHCGRRSSPCELTTQQLATQLPGWGANPSRVLQQCGHSSCGQVVVWKASG